MRNRFTLLLWVDLGGDSRDERAEVGAPEVRRQLLQLLRLTGIHVSCIMEGAVQI